MKNEAERRVGKLINKSVGDQLDALNARMRRKRNSADAIRRSMEGQIEAKAKRRRSKEVEASAGWKKN